MEDLLQEAKELVLENLNMIEDKAKNNQDSLGKDLKRLDFLDKEI